MNKETKVSVKTLSLQDLVSNNNIAKQGSGNPFWIVDLNKLYEFECTIRLSKNKNIYLEPILTDVKNADGTQREGLRLSLGDLYKSIQTYEGNVDEVITVRCATRSVNPSITQDDLDAVALRHGDRAIQAYVQAKANNEQTTVLVAFDEL